MSKLLIVMVLIMIFWLILIGIVIFDKPKPTPKVTKVYNVEEVCINGKLYGVIVRGPEKGIFRIYPMICKEE